VLREVELLLRKRRHEPRGNSEGEINFVFENLLLKLEMLTRRENIVELYHVLRIIDLILKNKLVTFENKETWNLVGFLNNIFNLHDTLVGSQIARRVAQRSKQLLTYILRRSILIALLCRGYQRRPGARDKGAAQPTQPQRIPDL